MLDLINQVMETNKYLQRELEQRERTIMGLKAKLAAIDEEVLHNPEGVSPDELLKRIEDLLELGIETYAWLEENPS
jgi:hypothetical protein